MSAFSEIDSKTNGLFDVISFGSNFGAKKKATKHIGLSSNTSQKPNAKVIHKIGLVYDDDELSFVPKVVISSASPFVGGSLALKKYHGFKGVVKFDSQTLWPKIEASRKGKIYKLPYSWNGDVDLAGETQTSSFGLEVYKGVNVALKAETSLKSAFDLLKRDGETGTESAKGVLDVAGSMSYVYKPFRVLAKCENMGKVFSLSLGHKGKGDVAVSAVVRGNYDIEEKLIALDHAIGVKVKKADEVKVSLSSSEHSLKWNLLKPNSARVQLSHKTSKKATVSLLLAADLSEAAPASGRFKFGLGLNM